MTDDTNWLVHDHRKYDEALGHCGLVAGAGEWKEAVRLFNAFVQDLSLHMRMEDEVLYPAVVEETGDPDHEIADLGEEHDDIVRLLRDLQAIIKTNDIDHFDESLPHLHRALREHNAHEEAALRRMGTGSILMRRDEILARLHALQPKRDPLNGGL